jgi:hypothetical protein
MHLYNILRERPKLRIESLMIRKMRGKNNYTLSIIVTNSGLREIPACMGNLIIKKVERKMVNEGQIFRLYWMRKSHSTDNIDSYDLKPGEWNVLLLSSATDTGEIIPRALPNDFPHIAKLIIFAGSAKKIKNFWYRIPTESEYSELIRGVHWNYLGFPLWLKLWKVKRKFRKCFK